MKDRLTRINRNAQKQNMQIFLKNERRIRKLKEKTNKIKTPGKLKIVCRLTRLCLATTKQYYFVGTFCTYFNFHLKESGNK